MIKIRRLPNILQDPGRQEPLAFVSHVPGRRVRDYAPAGFDLDAGNFVSLDHKALTGDEVDTLEVRDGAEILFGDVPRGLGAPIAIAIGLAMEETLAATIIGAVIDFIIVGAVSTGLSYGIAALSNPMKAQAADNEDGPVHNWNGIQDTTGPGVPINYVFGKVRTGGHFLSSFERPLSTEQGQQGITTLHTLLGICVGPIESVSDIQINGNDLTSEAYPGVSTDIRLGTYDQAPIPGFIESVHEVVHQAAIRYDDGVQVYQTTEECDGFEVIFRAPAGLYQTDTESGATREASVTFEIQYRAANGTTTYPKTKVCTAKGRSPLKFHLRVDGLQRAIWELRIRRLTPDDASNSSVTLTEVYAISSIVEAEQSHPGLAKLAIKSIPNEQVNGSVPTTYTFLVEGFNEVRRYVDEATYTIGWSDNPAWCCAYWLTSKTVGPGEPWDAIDLPSFLRWAQYCDAMVPDGRGGMEKRCTFDYAFDSSVSRDQVLQIFQQGSACTLLKRGLRWYAILDEEEAECWVSTEANTLPGSTRTGIPLRERANRIRMSFDDAANDYQRDSHMRPLPGLRPSDAVIDASRDLAGVTRRSQAEREIVRYLLHNKYADWRVELEATLSSLPVYPGKVFGYNCIQAGVGLASGRILSVSDDAHVLELDVEILIEEGKAYEITIQHASNSTIDVRRIGSAPGRYQRISVLQADWTGTMAAGDFYAFGIYEQSRELYRCVSATLTEKLTRRIVGLKYDPRVYTFDLNLPESPRPPGLPDPRRLPPDVLDLQLYEHQVFAQDGTLQDVIDVDWSAPVSAALDHYEVWYRTGTEGAWAQAGTTKYSHFEIVGVSCPEVTYEVVVVSVSANGQKKSLEMAPRQRIVTQGMIDQPPNCTGLSVVLIDGTLVATCERIDPAILRVGGYYEWRRGVTWKRSVLLDRTPSPRLELKSYSRGTTNILVKARNSVGNYSPDAASFQLTLYGQVEENVILSQSEAPTWGGTLQGLRVTGSKLELWEPQTSIVSAPPIGQPFRGMRTFGFGFPDPVRKVVLSAVYTTDPIEVSAGTPVLARADANIEFTPIDISLGTLDEADWSFDDERAQIPFEGLDTDAVSVIVQSRISTTTTADAAWSTWVEHRNRGEQSMKYIQFRLLVEVNSDAYSVELEKFDIAIDLPDKIQSGISTVGSATAQDVDYPTSYFHSVKRLLVTLIGGGNGSYFKITAQDATGFTFEIRDSSHALIPGTIHYEARGY